jgi:hypothetical protein
VRRGPRILVERYRDRVDTGLPTFGPLDRRLQNLRRRYLETLGIGAPAGWLQAANRGLLRWRDGPPGRRQAGLWDINAESWGIPIVVLPFANLSKDPEQQYFADAITNELTTDLSRISGSFVIAATTAFTYKGKGLGANQIGHELGVRLCS